MKPKKHLGQHFLRDLNIARKIASTLPAEPGEQVVEIGPGLGALTQFLLEKWPNLMAVEFDHEAAAELRTRFTPGQLQVFHADFLDWIPGQFLDAPSWFIGNLPYNISSQIFFHLIEHRDWVKGGVFMVQKEVADRIVSPPGNKAYGILSVLLGCYFDLLPGFRVPPSVFHPPPKVQSAVFSIRRKTTSETVIYNSLKLVVKKAFNQRRKTLRNALKELNFAEGCEALFPMRAEQLTIEQFKQLAKALQSPA